MSSDILSEQDYEAIEAAVMETERGRWFLREYAARNRVANTAEILDVLNRIEGRLAAAPLDKMAMDAPSLPEPVVSTAPPPADIAVISVLIAAARAEMVALREEAHHNGRTLREGDDFDAISAASDHAINSVLNAAERIQELSWILRERGMEAASCDELDQRASEIYLACSFQDMASRRLEALVETLIQIDAHIARNPCGIEAAPEPAALLPMAVTTHATSAMRDAPPPPSPRPQNPVSAAVELLAEISPPAATANPPSSRIPERIVPTEPRPRRAAPHHAGNLALSHDEDLLELTAPAIQHGINYDELSFNEKIALFS